MKQGPHKQQSHSAIAWLLILTFVAQTLFPLQLHTQTVQTSSGRTVVLCTLDGLKSVVVDDQGRISEEQYQQHNSSSAAVKFSQLMGCSTPATPSINLVSTFVPDLTPTTSVAISLTVDATRLQPIRAPPAA